MKYFIMYLKLRITLFIATHFYMEPEYLKELYREFLEYGFDDMFLIASAISLNAPHLHALFNKVGKP